MASSSTPTSTSSGRGDMKTEITVPEYEKLFNIQLFAADPFNSEVFFAQLKEFLVSSLIAHKKVPQLKNLLQNIESKFGERDRERKYFKTSGVNKEDLFNNVVRFFSQILLKDFLQHNKVVTIPKSLIPIQTYLVAQLKAAGSAEEFAVIKTGRDEKIIPNVIAMFEAWIRQELNAVVPKKKESKKKQKEENGATAAASSSSQTNEAASPTVAPSAASTTTSTQPPAAAEEKPKKGKKRSSEEKKKEPSAKKKRSNDQTPSTISTTTATPSPTATAALPPSPTVHTNLQVHVNLHSPPKPQQASPTPASSFSLPSATSTPSLGLTDFSTTSASPTTIKTEAKPSAAELSSSAFTISAMMQQYEKEELQLYREWIGKVKQYVATQPLADAMMGQCFTQLNDALKKLAGKYNK